MAESEKPLDPRFVVARREAWLILLAWLVCLVWTVGYAAFTGYNLDGASSDLVLGMPAWIVWGVILPWVSATVFSVGFSLFFIKEE